MPPTKGAARLVDGFFAWKLHREHDLKALVQWRYNSFPRRVPPTDLWRMTGEMPGYWGLALPTPDGDRVPICEWEWEREGVDDLRYCYTLQRLIDEAGTTSASRRAQRDLDAILASITHIRFGEVGEGDGTLWWDVPAFDGNRRIIADHILALQREGAEPGR